MTEELTPATGPDAINNRWHKGRTVWITKTGEPVTVRGNRIYATDSGAEVRRADGTSDTIHWTRLSLNDPNGENNEG